ncbi:MAG: preprotein translocase subunit SecA [Methylophilales bacterium BACL14 MAG-120920-bin58]|mgnify:FL=1|jgi:preprotein translocase subunit SecA|nr:MAG: preprotein translocase subunit SecA [Methylophilales bacterium BACL14 MAG-120920-bin58]
MLKKIIGTFFGSRNDRLLKEYTAKVAKINALEPKIKKLKDNDFPKKTIELKNRFNQGEALDTLLIEAFAHVREAGIRSLGMRHFDEQLLGAMALHDGKISEMRTGEGKTLVATLAVYLNALSGNGVHVVTVNDYLAKRDAEWMGKLYNFLGLEVGINLSRMPAEEKKNAYEADITYGTNNEFGFDYLRDNMVYSPGERVQKPLNFAVVDEVDSILIDEARTPLIISGQSENNTDLYLKIDKIIPYLVRQEKEDAEGDFWIDEKAHQAILSEKGHEKTEELLLEMGILTKGSNLYDATNISLLHHVNSALKAHYLFIKDKDYVVKDGSITIVDEFTGRMMPGRRWSDGLHQAVEAKEGVVIQKENQTMASITFQNYFRMYSKLAGMTGTADTEAEEFNQIYNLETIIIPPHRPTIRNDKMDKIYRTSEERYQAVLDDIIDCNKRLQPVLVGTTSIENSELISNRLTKAKLKHQVLNAKQHEKEAHIISQAGQPGMITIATNMAGRGTDIVLGGNTDAEIIEIENNNKIKGDKKSQKIKDLMAAWKLRNIKVLDAGGLHIIGTERHESRRVDNQLRGRSGRQGDPGSSAFYLSLEDSLLRIFASERIASIMEKLNMPEGEAIEHKWVNRSIEGAQKKVEARNFDIRKQLLEYDDIPNQQRKVIYEQRNDILDNADLKETVDGIIGDVLEQTVYEYIPLESIEEMWDIPALEKRLQADYAIKITISKLLKDDQNIAVEDIASHIKQKGLELYRLKEKLAGKEALQHFERSITLQIFDHHWRAHLSSLDNLRQGIGLRAYGQKDPKQEFKKEAFVLFEQLLETIKFEITRVLMLVSVKDENEAKKIDKKNQEAISAAQTEKSSTLAGTDKNTDKKVGRNEPCPCGSGKKYKHCHGILN